MNFEEHLMNLLYLAILILPIALSHETAIAHSGGLNSQGCHAGSRPYHCHRSSNVMVGNRIRCDLGSRSKECIKPSSARPRPSPDVYELQIGLMRHCRNLPSNFVDRRFGPATRAALKQFQASYGLTPDGVYGPRTAAALNGPVTGACK